MSMRMNDQTRDEAEATNSRQSALQGGQGDRGRGSGLSTPAHDNGTFCLCLSNYLSKRRVRGIDGGFSGVGLPT
jgi:hypothetical protein